eukprot:6322006-Prymnesium_polylepis.1
MPSKASPNVAIKGPSADKEFSEFTVGGQKENQVDPDLIEAIHNYKVRKNTHVEETSFVDIALDIISGRFIEFYRVPKVKFTLHLISHLCYMLYLSYVLLGKYDHMRPVVTSHEVFFWLWTFARAVGEVSELEQFDDYASFTRSIRLYMLDSWNKVDLLNVLVVMPIIVMRCMYAPSDSDPVSDARRLAPSAASSSAASSVASGATSSTDLNVLYSDAEHLWPRTLYAVVLILVFMRVLQFMRYFSSVGVLTICLGSMSTDVGLFIIILLPLTCGFSVAQAVLQPRQQLAED